MARSGEKGPRTVTMKDSGRSSISQSPSPAPGDRLRQLRVQRNTREIDPCQYYSELALLLDGTPQLECDDSYVLRHTQRINALIQSKFGFNPEKDGGAPKRQLPRELSQLLERIAKLQPEPGLSSTRSDKSAKREFNWACQKILDRLVSLEPKPVEPDGTPRRRSLVFSVRGVVRAIRHEPGMQVALADVDGIIVEIWSPAAAEITVGDRIVAVGAEEGKVGPFFDFTKNIGGPTIGRRVTRTAALLVLAGATGAVTSLVLFVNDLRSNPMTVGIWKPIILGLGSLATIAVACILTIASLNVWLLERALDRLISADPFRKTDI